MEAHISAKGNAAAACKVTVLGSYIVDLMVRTPHLPVTGETVRGSIFRYGPGGKGSNQGVAAHRAGARVAMITKVGSDIFADAALETYRTEGMDTAYVYRSTTAATGAALIMVDETSGANKITVVPGASDHITSSEVEQARKVIEESDIFLTQFETNLDVVDQAVDIAHRAGVRVILNPAPAQSIDDALLQKVAVITPNETEAAVLTGIAVDSRESALRAGRALRKRGAGIAIITLGDKGSLIVTGEGAAFVPPIVVKAVDTTGAGDAYNGGLAVALAEGKSIESAARFATATAALSVTRPGTAPSMPRRAEIDAILNAGNGPSTQGELR